MSASTAWFRSDQSTMRTRLVMAGAFFGALVLLTMSMLFSWPVAVNGAQAHNEAAVAFDSPAGTCLDWPVDNPRDMRKVDCVQPHTFEVTSRVEISGEFPSGVPQPDEQRWQEIANLRCTEAGAAYLGGPLDPYGKYTVGALKPSDEQWADGDRRLLCGLQRVTPMGTRLQTTGSATASQDQSNVHEPGTCFALVDNAVGDPIDCSQVHSYEVVGNVDVGAALGTTFPTEAKQQDKLAELCAKVVTAYSGGASLTTKKLSLYWDTLKEESWAAGSRMVDCKVGARLPDGSGLAPVTGSLRAVPASSAPAPSGSSSVPPSK